MHCPLTQSFMTSLGWIVVILVIRMICPVRWIYNFVNNIPACCHAGLRTLDMTIVPKFSLGARSHQTRLLKAQPLQKRLGKGDATVERSGVRNRPLILGSRYFFKKKKGKSTADTTIYSANCVSIALPTERESVGVEFRVGIRKLFVIKYR